MLLLSSHLARMTKVVPVIVIGGVMNDSCLGVSLARLVRRGLFYDA